jgi:hypothetical protein
LQCYIEKDDVVHSLLGIFAVGHRENNKLAATHRQRLLLPSTIMKSRMFVSGHRLHYNKEKHQWGERNIPK